VRECVRISIDRQRKVFIDDDEVSLLGFEKELRRVFPGPGTPVILNADQRVPYGFVVQVINTLQKVGVEKLSFLTEMPPKEGSP
jgi:biopolymer transport protein ExbD